MLQEELKKNYILLSKVAKENKYAQEYLGLLARRGDLGSIRIGKRWYTTPTWFQEFENDAKRKKAEMKALQTESKPAEAEAAEKTSIGKIIVQPRVAEIAAHDRQQKVGLKRNIEIKSENAPTEKIFLASQIESVAVHGNIGVEKEKVALKINAQPKIKTSHERINEIFSAADQPLRFQMRNKSQSVSLVKKINADFSKPVKIRNSASVRTQSMGDIAGRERFQNFKRMKTTSPVGFQKENIAKMKNFFREENKPSEIRQRTENFHISETAKEVSPAFFPKEKMRMGFFPKFAFAGSLVLLFFLITAFGYFHKKEILSFAGFDSGVVAGAEDSKTNLASLKSQSIDYLGNQGNEVKEKISLTRVIISAALEKENK